MLKTLNSRSKTITGAAILIASATLISRAVGLLRDRIFAHYFGAGPIMDSYYAAFKIPDLIYNLLIVGALSAGFIPTFTKLFSSGEDKSPAWKLANNVLNIIAVALLVLSVLGIIFTPYIAPIIAPGFAQYSRDLVVSFTRVMFGSTFLLGLSMVIGGILQSLRAFFLYSLAPIFYNLGIILGVVALVPAMGAIGLAWGVVLGAFLHFALQTYSAYANGYRWHWTFNLKDKNTNLIWKLMAPRTLGLAISQLNLVVVTILASLLPIGSVAVFNYANNLQAVPIGIIGIPFALAVFPVLSAAVAEEDKNKFVKNLSSTVKQILFLIIPLSVVILLLRAQIVRVVLGSGQFDWSATINTADTLAMFALSLFAQALIPLLARAFYAMSNTKTPFVIGVISELISIIAALVLMKPLGVAGLALAFSVGSFLNFALLSAGLRDILKPLGEEDIFKSLAKFSAAAIAMALAVQYIFKPGLNKFFNLDYFYGVLGQGMLAGLGGLVIYFAVCYFLRVPEFIYFKDAFKRRFLRIKDVQAVESIETSV